MVRDHYKGAPGQRHALLNKAGELEGTNLRADIREISGTATLSGNGWIQVSDVRIKTASYALITPEMSGPTDVNYDTSAGVLTISGTGTGTVAYLVKI